MVGHRARDFPPWRKLGRDIVFGYVGNGSSRLLTAGVRCTISCGS
jgi:hypothetical protein